MTEANSPALNTPAEVVLSARQDSLRAYLRELYEFRELLAFLVWKDIKVQFAHTTLGFGWLVLRPLLNVLILTLVFGKIARIPTGDIPYLLFAFASIVPWNYFSGVAGKAALSLTGANSALITKVYFPRTYIPLSMALSGMVESIITVSIFLIVSILFYGRWPGLDMLWLPVPILLLLLTTAGFGLWLSALAVDFRDVRFASAYLLQLLMFTAPVIWPVAMIPARFGATGDNFLDWYAFYPLVGIVEGFRAALLGSTPMPWDYLAKGFATASVLAVSGLAYFRRRELLLADLV